MLFWEESSSTLYNTGPMKEVFPCTQESRYSVVTKALSKATWLLLELVAYFSLIYLMVVLQNCRL